MSLIASAAVSLALLGTASTAPKIDLASIQTGGHTQSTHIVTASATKKADKPATPAPVYVTVQDGDTLDAIAQAHNTTWVRLYDANDFISDPNVINVGDQIRIPRDDETLVNRDLPAAPVVETTPAPAATPAPAVTAAPRAAPAVSYAVVGNDAKSFIYSHESGNNPNAMSPNGCYGLGQDCSGRVLASCGADYACQDAYFTNYAMSRYGSWEAAASFWQANGWW